MRHQDKIVFRFHRCIATAFGCCDIWHAGSLYLERFPTLFGTYENGYLVF